MPIASGKQARLRLKNADSKKGTTMEKHDEQPNSNAKTLVDRRDLLVAGAATLAGSSLLGLGAPAEAEAAEGVQDRMPPIPPNQMTAAQKDAAAAIMAGPRKAVVGPFIPLMRSPDLMNRLQKVGEYLRYNTKLGSNISEFIILQMARHMTQQFEWFSHVDLARKAGVKEETITAIAEGRRPTGMTPDETMVYEFVSEIRQHQSVSDAAYAPIVKRFGEQGVIDITALCGYYTTLGYVMNVARTPLPPGSTPGLALFPH
jgi:4-carboxymuconolactone decarboxylase